MDLESLADSSIVIPLDVNGECGRTQPNARSPQSMRTSSLSRSLTLLIADIGSRSCGPGDLPVHAVSSCCSKPVLRPCTAALAELQLRRYFAACRACSNSHSSAKAVGGCTLRMNGWRMIPRACWSSAQTQLELLPLSRACCRHIGATSFGYAAMLTSLP